MATMKDVAARAGVSIATVSNYLNHTKPVSRTASARIKLAIEELDFTQNLSAKSLKSNVYRDIGVILPNSNDSYYVQIFQGIESLFQNSGYYLNLSFSYDIPEMEENIVRNFLRKQVCGLIMVTCRCDAWKFYYENFTKKNRPVILIDRDIQSLDTSLISFDNQAAFLQMTLQLLSQGYRRIKLISGPERFTCEAGCIQGFYEAHRLKNLIPARNAVIQTELNKEDSFRQTTRLLRDELPEVLLSTSELTATGIIEGLNVLGYSTKDIPVVTLGEEHWNQYTHSFASASTARPAIKMGESAAKLLIESLKSPQTFETERILLSEHSVTLPSPLTPRLPVPAVSTCRESLRILLLDTPPVHTFCTLLKNFEDKTGGRVEVQICKHNSLYEEIQKNNDSDTPCDVFMYDLPWLSMLASDGTLEDISELLSDIDTDAFLPDCLQYYSRFETGFYGVPFIYAPQILYYRKDLFENEVLRSAFEKLYKTSLRPPITFKEFNAVADFFTNKSDALHYGISIPAAYDECLAPELYMRLRAYGSEVVDKYGNFSIHNPNARKAYINFVRATRFAKPDFLEATDVSIIDDFLHGETAMLITYPVFMTNIANLQKSSLIGSVGCTNIPGRSPILGGWSFGIHSKSTKKEAAGKFLAWTFDEQIGNYFALQGGQPAIRSTYTNDELVKLYPWLPLYQSAYQYAKPMFPPVKKHGEIISPNEIDTIICKHAYRMIQENCEIDDILFQTQAELDAL